MANTFAPRGDSGTRLLPSGVPPAPSSLRPPCHLYLAGGKRGRRGREHNQPPLRSHDLRRIRVTPAQCWNSVTWPLTAKEPGQCGSVGAQKKGKGFLVKSWLSAAGAFAIEWGFVLNVKGALNGPPSFCNPRMGQAFQGGQDVPGLPTPTIHFTTRKQS